MRLMRRRHSFLDPFAQFLISAVGCVISLSAYTTDAQFRSKSLPVIQVVDGDTLGVARLGRIRLLGIDAPELGGAFDTAAPFAREARERLIALVKDRWVRLEFDDRSKDRYGRRLAYVFREDGLFVNAAMVRDGLARVSARRALRRLPELRRAQDEAQRFRRGTWGATPARSETSYKLLRPRRSSSPLAPRQRCEAKTRSGKRCARSAVGNERYCRQHAKHGN